VGAALDRAVRFQARVVMRTTTLLRSDVRNVVRDPLLLLVVAVPLLLAGLVRIAFPWATAAAAPHFALGSYAPFVVGYMLVLTPMLVGGAVGFMLLDEREAGVLAAIAVTPLGKRGWLVYRVTGPVVVTMVMGFVAVFLTGLAPPPIARLVVIVALAAAEAPFATLFLAAFAANKVQAIALAKAGGLLVVAPFAALAVADPWQLLAGILPQYWIVKLALIDASDTMTFATLAAAAVLVHGIALSALARTYERRAE
jgi:fluoroquinolone transport system permease protein